MVYLHCHYIDSDATPIDCFENEEFRSFDVETQVIDVMNSDYVQNVVEWNTYCRNSLHQEKSNDIEISLMKTHMNRGALENKLKISQIISAQMLESWKILSKTSFIKK